MSVLGRHQNRVGDDGAKHRHDRSFDDVVLVQCFTQLQEDVLEDKIAKKELSPNLTLETARTWKRELSIPKKKVSKRLAPVYATLKVESTSKLKVNSVKIQKCLEQLKKLGILVEIKNPYK